MSLPPLKSLPIFETVARLNSFSKAAEELNLTQSAVSHQIKLLENYLGESLFIRQGRNLSMTHEGKAYLDSISTSLELISRASNQIKGQEQTQIRLALYSSFAISWLIPRLNDFKRQYPLLDVSIEMTHFTPELSDRIADCFVTTEEQKRGFSFETLYEERLFPACSPAMLAQIQIDLGTNDINKIKELLIATPSLLLKYPLITTYSIYKGYAIEWKLWFQEQGVELPSEVRFQKFSHLLLAYEAAKYDQGITLINDYMLKEQSSEGNLITLPIHSLKTNDKFSFVFKTSRRNEAGINQLKQWITQQSRTLEWKTETD
ncbi:LysR substrate-binding domain-containing protein [Marinomonas sp. 15G1-11]|uniref:LysR substrate-binding domain-containing protein n=1 Tax=Marinomonas phaeophyticola TaxID=3004091 RepID=A0ABT4JXK5_9GAMM|nr:LysR family transcriptional regulator [Marinomonas sp. 15G1-11]MCZ2723110.1 LysR substrate-binding domain-containing protein [Marinomonas sp. 15G1-11]